MAIISNATTGRVDEGFINTGALLRSDNLLFGKVTDRYGEADYLSFLETNKNWTVADDTIINWHEDGYILNNVKIASFTGGATVGATAVVTIASSQHQDGGTKSPFTPNMVAKVKGVYLYVLSKSEAVDNAHTITVKEVPQGGAAQSVALDTVLASGGTIIPIARQYAEGTAYDEGEQRLPERFSENIGIFKDKATVTRTQATNKFKVMLNDEGDYYWANRMDRELFLRHKLGINYGLILGAGGSTTDTNGDTVNMAKGIEQQIRERGNTYQYNSFATLNDIENITRLLKRENAPTEQMITEGHEMCLTLDRFITDTMQGGAIRYLDLTKQGSVGTVGGKMKIVDFTNNGFNVGGYTFYRKRLPEFDHPQVTYGNDQNYSTYGMITPMAIEKDPVTSERGFAMRIGYKSAPSAKGVKFDRKFQFTVGGDGFDSETDETNFRYLTECGIVLVNANQGVIMEKA